MKRYWVFATDNYWPRGGESDLVWETNDLREAEWVRYNLNRFQHRWVIDSWKYNVPPENEDLVRRLMDELASSGTVAHAGKRKMAR